MIGPQLAMFTQDVMSSPFVAQLMGDLMQRQGRSMQLVARLHDRSIGSPALWPFHAVPMPVSIAEAQGARLRDADGNEYLDLFLGFGTQALHGHNPPHVVDAVRRSLGKTVGNGYFHEIELELTEVLRTLAPANEAFIFLNSGTDATDAAVRLCRAKTGRRLMVKMESAVHGTHDWGVQSSVALMHGHPFQPWPAHSPDGVQAVPFARGVSPASRDDLLILPHLDLDALSLLDARRDEIACVIAESCNISFPFPEKCLPYLRALSERCKALGIPFILDEVQTGFRWGPGGVAHSEGIDADLRVYGKVLSGLGVPLSAVGGPLSLLGEARTTGLNMTDFGQKTTLMTTHMGNHLALLASHASLSHLLEKGDAYYVRQRARLARLQARLSALRDEEDIPLHLVGYGDFIGTFLLATGHERARNARQLAECVNPAATLLLSLTLRRRGIYTYSWPFLFLGDAYTDEDIDTIGDTVIAAARELRDGGVPLVVPWAQTA